jgi:hypothetical protein
MTPEEILLLLAGAIISSVGAGAILYYVFRVGNNKVYCKDCTHTPEQHANQGANPYLWCDASKRFVSPYLEGCEKHDAK